PTTHAGFWRHLAIREATGLDGRGALLVSLFTTSRPSGPDDGAAPIVAALAATLTGGLGVAGFEWRVTDAVADVARGELRQRWGDERVAMRLGDRVFALGPQSFFQTNTAGTVILYDTIAEALRRGAGADRASTLIDLYCGVGAIGLYLAPDYQRSIGIEENPDAVDDARLNAARNGVDATFFAAKVEDRLGDLDGADVVVDPPRAGLHPKVAAHVGAARWASLVYVACNPASLGRDRPALEAHGGRLTDLFTVDLFPHTGHVEVVARFAR
ncbi:MAG: methyltransferase domain-containing protein, partial [Myxococcota bacterium]